jgi:hypothetical protein
MASSRRAPRSVSGSYDELIQALLAILDDLTGREREAFFSGCAVREYQPSAGPLSERRASSQCPRFHPG